MNDYEIELLCQYKSETYSVRNNGSVLRHPKVGKKPRPTDNKWTFGKYDIKTGYAKIAGESVHRIIATAFLGPAPSSQHVVDHIDTNRRNNRPENLRWITKLENILLNPITVMMLMFLMRDGKADTVVEQFDMLTGLLGLEEFRKVFPVILTDNGSEFKHTRDLETTEDGKKRTKVFYCDPQASWQKPQIEKNHEFIRYVLPKGKTLNPYTQEDMLLLANNINSIRRESLGNKSPYEATTDKSILRLMELMGLHTVPADEVNLTPALLKR